MISVPPDGFAPLLDMHSDDYELGHRIAKASEPIKRETGMPMFDSRTELRRFGIGKNHQELAQFIEGHINRVASGRIRDLHVVYSDDKIILQGRSRTYHAKQLAHQAVLDLTDGYPLLANQIVVS